VVTFEKPVKITESHDVSAFSCGNDILDKWLANTSLRNQNSGASTTYVVCKRGTKVVVGYFCLSAASIVRSDAPSNISRNQPDLIPAMLLGRLAVDVNHKKTGMGRNLFVEAYKISTEAASLVGIRALLVHAINDDAKAFWSSLGFRESPTNHLTLMLKLG
jgi:predicted N-acetyltransferase YhbS